MPNVLEFVSEMRKYVPEQVVYSFDILASDTARVSHTKGTLEDLKTLYKDKFGERLYINECPIVFEKTAYMLYRRLYRIIMAEEVISDDGINYSEQETILISESGFTLTDSCTGKAGIVTDVVDLVEENTYKRGGHLEDTLDIVIKYCSMLDITSGSIEYFHGYPVFIDLDLIDIIWPLENSVRGKRANNYLSPLASTCYLGELGDKNVLQALMYRTDTICGDEEDNGTK